MITDALAVLLALIVEQEKQKYKDGLIPIRTVAIAGGAHSPEAVESTPEPEPEPEPTLPQVASATLLLDLQADTLVLNDGDPVSTWADQSGNGRDFTQAGTARPTKQTDGGYSSVVFDGSDDTLNGSDFADNLPAFAVFFAAKMTADDNTALEVGKTGVIYATAGWSLTVHYAGLYYVEFICESDAGNEALYLETDLDDATPWTIYTGEVLSLSEAHLYVNGSNAAENDFSYGTLTDYSSAKAVRIGTDDSVFILNKGSVRALMIYQITDTVGWAADRAAITAWLAARYGITL